jgi:hypothetical protein
MYVEDQPSFINSACIVTQKQSTSERQVITHAERPGGLYLLFGECCIPLHATKGQYLEDATNLGLFLSTEPSVVSQSVPSY